MIIEYTPPRCMLHLLMFALNETRSYFLFCSVVTTLPFTLIIFVFVGVVVLLWLVENDMAYLSVGGDVAAFAPGSLLKDLER